MVRRLKEPAPEQARGLAFASQFDDGQVTRGKQRSRTSEETPRNTRRAVELTKRARSRLITESVCEEPEYDRIKRVPLFAPPSRTHRASVRTRPSVGDATSVRVGRSGSVWTLGALNFVGRSTTLCPRSY